MKIEILYEDKDIFAIDKPSGLSVHPDWKSKEKTLTDWVLKNYPKMKNVGESIFAGDEEIRRPGIVHRLDKETSGVLLLAKNQKAYRFLKSQFKNWEIKKTYDAIVSGFVKNDHGTINKPIGRSPKDFRRRLAGRGARGELREAITEYKVLKRFEAPLAPNFSSSSRSKIQSKSHTDKNSERVSLFSYLEIHPKTGRTHQIRVHMKYINHPIACDTLYNPNGPCPLGLDRLALHAKSVEFKSLKGEAVKIKSPLPKEFTIVLSRERA